MILQSDLLRVFCTEVILPLTLKRRGAGPRRSLQGQDGRRGGGQGRGTVASHQSDLFTPTLEAFPRVLVEHDGLRVLVHHLGHVSQDVLLGDDAQQTPGQTGGGVRRRSEVTSG